jgi:hypothetical protein
VNPFLTRIPVPTLRYVYVERMGRQAYRDPRVIAKAS